VVGSRARVAAGARVERSVLWDGAVVEGGARVCGAIVVTGAVVRSGERAEDVIVMKAAAFDARGEAGGRVERRGDMAWVELR
jgi:mannose-1-phosphate guanylyltransferase